MRKNIPKLEFKPNSDPYRWIAGKKTMDQEHYIEEIRKEIRDIEVLLKEEDVLKQKIGNCEGLREKLNKLKESDINDFNKEINLF